MGYEAAIKKAWDELALLSGKDRYDIRLLNRIYEIDVKKRSAAGKDFLTILLLHYVAGKLRSGFIPSGEWISFKDIEGGDFYYPAFREGAINPIIKKFGSEPLKLFAALDTFTGDRIKFGDAAIELVTFDDVRLRIIIWKGDNEFAAESTILFDKNLPRLFSTEDIAVFLRFVAHLV